MASDGEFTRGVTTGGATTGGVTTGGVTTGGVTTASRGTALLATSPAAVLRLRGQGLPWEPPRTAEAERCERERLARLRETLPAPLPGFVVDTDDGRSDLLCLDVRGFGELVATLGGKATHPIAPAAPTQSRLALDEPSAELSAWLDGWSEDVARVGRGLTVRRRFDGRAIAVTVTLGSYGHGVVTSLVVERANLVSVG